MNMEAKLERMNVHVNLTLQNSQLAKLIDTEETAHNTKTPAFSVGAARQVK
jgi:hypothetical protein